MSTKQANSGYSLDCFVVLSWTIKSWRFCSKSVTFFVSPRSHPRRHCRLILRKKESSLAGSTSIRMYCGSETIDLIASGQPEDAAAAYVIRSRRRMLTRWQHFSAWNDVMAAVLKMWHHIKIRLRQSMRIYLKNRLPNCILITNPIWNNGALGFFEERRPSKNNIKMISDMGSVPDQTTVIRFM